MSPSRRTRRPPRPAFRRTGVLLLICLSLAAPLAYALARGAASAQRQADGAAREKRRAFVPGEILVRFRVEPKSGDAEAEGGRRVASLRLPEGREIPVEFESPRGLQVVRGLRLARVPAADTLAAIESLRARADVLYAEPNYVRRKFATPNDPSFASQWALKNTGQPFGVAGADIDAEPAWDATTGSGETVVGVIDEGVDITHPDLQANVWTNPGETPGNGLDDDGSGYADDLHGWDFFHNDATVFDATGAFPSDETDAHGTHVAGIIGASGNNGQGVAGVNWNVKLLPMKILGREGEAAAPSSVLETVRAYGYAKTLRDLYAQTGGAKGANLRVLNNSYGGYGESQAERDAIRALGDAGVLFVAASGNDGRSNDRTPLFPAGYNEPNVITVGATTRFDHHAVFSNFSPRSVHMAAPGDDILSTTPGGTYALADGTSMAAPHVAGVAALVLAANPSISLTRLRAALLLGGDRLQELGPGAFGGGLVTGRRLNAAGSLAAAAEADSAPPGAVTNFRVTFQQGRSLNLEWMVPGEDGAAGERAPLFEIRFSETDPRALDAAQFQRSYVLFAPLPANTGTFQTTTVQLPFRHPAGFVGIRALDAAGNAGPVSAAAVSVEQDTSDPYTLSTSAPEPLSTGGEKLNLVGDDLYSSLPYQLPFDFTFFGQTGRGLNVSTNGVLYFGEGPRVPTAFGGNNDPDDSISSVPRLAGYRMIAALWDDLRTDRRTGGDVYVVKPDPTRIIFRWQGVTYWKPGPAPTALDENPVNFEVELRRDGTIVKRYGDGNAFVFPVVGISGGDPDPYVAATHTSEFSPTSLANAPTVVYTPRKPTPAPTPDVAVGMRVTPDPATSGQLLTYQLDAVSRGSNSWAEQTRVTTQVPAGTTLVSVAATPAHAAVSAPPAGSTSGAITIDFGTIFSQGSGGTATVVVRVDAPPGSTVNNTATVQSFWQDPDPSNNTATTVTQIVETPAFGGVRGLSAGGMGGNSDSHTVSVKTDGTVWAWGGGNMGQLGDGASSGSPVPVLVDGFSGATAAAAGGIHTVALKSDGTVWAWGSNQYGQLGTQEQFLVTRTRPSQVPGLSNVTAVAAGGSHNLALKSDGTVWAWGSNTSGQVGNGTFTQAVYDAVQVSGLSNVRAIAAGPDYSLAVKTDGTVWGWGASINGFGPGVLGLPSGTFSTSTPAQIAGVSNVESVAAGFGHVLAVKSDGTVWSWGANHAGQLGDGTTTGGQTPRQVAGLSNVSAVEAGAEHSVALRADGTVWAWGSNGGGLVGDGTTVNRSAPAQVAVGGPAVAVAAGIQHTGAVLSDGTVRMWGANSSGQLGDRTNVGRNSPVQVSGALPVATPTFSPDGGSFQFQQGVMIHTATPGATIRYTLNGDDPTEADPSIGGGQTFFLSTTTTVKARAFKPGWPASAVKAATFTFPVQQPTPTPTPAPGAASQPLAFLRTGDFPASGTDIFIANLDGTGVVNLVGDPGNDFDPVWSPDGTRLAYTCFRKLDGTAGGSQRVCLRNADGTGFRVLSMTLTDDFQPAWSRDGRQLAFVSQNAGFSTTISIINADGTGLRPLNVTMLGAYRPDWSADGQAVAVEYVNSIWAVRVAGGEARRLTSGFHDSRPRYSPDGSKILFQRSDGGKNYICVMNADGTGQTRLVENVASDAGASWSPDGSKIVFAWHGENPLGGAPYIYTVNPDGTDQTKLFQGFQPTWRRVPSAIDSSGFFVAQHYRDFLSREADAPGLAFWTQGIDSCGADAGCREVKRVETSAAFFLSIEFNETGYLVYRAHKAAYGNLPGKPVPLTLSEFTPDTLGLGQNVVVNSPGWEGLLEANKQSYFSAFVSRARFGERYPAAMSAEAFVDALNQNAGQVLSAAERDALVQGLAGGTLTRAQVLRAVAEDADTQRQEFNRAFVLMQYFGYLRRNPDDAPEANLDFAGYNFWLSKLEEFGGDWRRAEMVKAFVSSAEYRKRFGQQ